METSVYTLPLVRVPICTENTDQSLSVLAAECSTRNLISHALELFRQALFREPQWKGQPFLKHIKRHPALDDRSKLERPGVDSSGAMSVLARPGVDSSGAMSVESCGAEEYRYWHSMPE